MIALDNYSSIEKFRQQTKPWRIELLEHLLDLPVSKTTLIPFKEWEGPEAAFYAFIGSQAFRKRHIYFLVHKNIFGWYLKKISTPKNSFITIQDINNSITFKSSIMNDTLTRIRQQHNVVIRDLRNSGAGFDIISQPFDRIKLVYSPAVKFHFKIIAGKPSELTLEVDAGIKMKNEFDLAITICTELNAKLSGK